MKKKNRTTLYTEWCKRQPARLHIGVETFPSVRALEYGTNGDGVVELMTMLAAAVVVVVDFNVCVYVKHTDKLLCSSGSLCNNFRPVFSYRFGLRFNGKLNDCAT